MSAYLEDCFPYLSRSSLQLSCFRFHPFHWIGSQVPVFMNSKLWHSNVALIFSYNVFVAFRALPVFLNPEASLENKFFLLLTLTSYAFGMICSSETVLVRHRLNPFVHSYIKFLEGQPRLGPATTTTKSTEVRICKWFLVMQRFSFYIIDASYLILSILRPSSPEYLSSFLTYGAQETVPGAWMALSGLFQLYITTLSTEPMKLLIGLLTIFMFSMVEFL